MADIEDFLAGKPAAAPQGGSQIDAFLGDAAPSRTLAGTARDIGVTALKGAVGLPQAVVGLADIPTGGRVGKALEGAGVRFKDAQDALGEMYSPAQQAANRKVREAEGFVGTAQAMLENPSTIATGIGESLPQMLGGAGVARGILAAAPRVGAVAAGALGEGVMGAGSAAEQIRGETADGLLTGKQAALAGASGAATAALGALGGKVAQRLGIGDVDTMLAQGSTRAVGQGSTRSMPRQIIEGGVAEGALEELPQSVAEQALQNVALERPWDEGVGAAAAQGLITGAAMGGAGGGVGASANRAQQRAEVQALQRTQAAIDSAEALTQQAQDEQRAVAVQSAQDAAVARAVALADEEAATPIADDEGAAAREQQVVARQLREQAQAASRGEASPDDEIYQSTGAGVPVEPMPQGAVDDALDLRAPSEQMGINPAAGPLSRAAAQAVDTQAVQSGNATGFATTADQGAYESGALAFQQGATRQELAAIPNVAARLQHLRGYDDAARQAAAATPAAPAASTTGDSLARQAQAIQASPQQPQAGGQAPAGRAAAREAQPVPAAATPAGGGGLQAAGLSEAPASIQARSLLQELGEGVGTYTDKLDARIADARARVAQAESLPPLQRQLSGIDLGGMAAELSRLESSRPAAQALDAQERRQDTERSMLRAARGELDASTLTPAQRQGAVQRAAARGNAADAAQVIFKAVDARPQNWRTSMLKAGPVAQALGIDTKGKRLAQVVAEIDALDARAEREVEQRAQADAEAGTFALTGSDRAADVLAAQGQRPMFSRTNTAKPTSLADVRARLDTLGVEHTLSESRGVLTVGKIVVPDGQRERGAGTAAMQSITDYADAAGLHVALSPSADFGGNKARLTQFYKRFGFKENKGRAKVYEVSEAMVRENPQGRPLFSRSADTRAAYEARIDALFADGKAERVGVKVLDRSDVLSLLGYADQPVVLAEGKVLQGRDNHPRMTAQAWKKIPEWLESPAAVFASDTVEGRLVFVAPEMVGGSPVRLIVEPNTQVGGLQVHLMLNAFDASGRTPWMRWAGDGLARYIDKKKFPAILAPSGLQLSRVEQVAQGTGRILSEKHLAGYRRANDPAFSGASGMTPEQAAAIVSAARPPSREASAAARRLSDERLVATQQLVDGLKEKWAYAPEIIVARNMQDSQIPQDVRDYDAKLKSQGSTGEAEGFIVDGKVFLLSDTLSTPNDIATVLFHEVLGHWGLRRAFGDTLDPILRQVAVMRGKDVRAKAREYGLDMTKEGDRLIAAEEVLAEMAQTNPQLTIVQRAIAAIRNWLRANVPGFKALAMTNNDIIEAFILPARGAVTRQNETMEQAVDRAVAAVRGDEAPRFSRSAAVTPAAADYTPEQTRAAEHAFGTITKQTWAERAQSFRANVGTKLRQGIVDQFAPIKEVSAKAYMLARLSKGSDGAVEAALLYGKPFLRDGVYDVDMKDGGFAQVLAGLKGEHDRFFQWVAAQRAERLKAEGKENLLTDRDITALKSLNAGRFADGTLRMPAYAAALRDLNAFNEATLKVAMESGLIDQAAYELMKDQPYVPFYRLMEEGDMRGPRFSSGLVNQQAWKKLKGGSQQLNADLLQNTLMNWSHLYAAAARNRASLETMAAADKMGIAYQVPADTKGAVKVMRDGVAEHWAVEDPYLLDAIMAMSYAPGGLVKAMAPFKRLLTFGVTVNPTFKIRNLIRDSLSAVSQSDLGYNPFANVASGWKATGRDSQTYASMLASGGIIKFGTQENTSRVRAQIERLGGQMLDKQGLDKFTGQMKALWEAYEEFGDRTENVNRAALYERLIAKGHSHAEASFMARDLMDFSMSGKWEAVRFLAQTVPFLNARLQGLYKLGRAAKEDPRRFAAMAGAVSMASLGLMAAYGDDDDWKKREDWDRDAYWWFKVGNTAFRIPKPFELGSIGTLAERTAELMMSDEMTAKRFGTRISDMVFNTFAMDPTPQFIKPFIDVYANKDSFSGRAIEGMADERLRPQDRYNERTSEIARLLGSWGLPDPVRLAKGEYSGLSPKQIDFLLRGYFGWLATVATTASDMAARPVLDRGDRPAMRMRDTFLAGNFVEALPTGSSRYVTAMYEQARDVEQAWASYQAAVKSGDMDKAREIQQDEAPKLRNRLAIANAKRQIAELGQQAKRIEGSRLLSADQKREQLDAIEARKHQVAQRVAVTG